MGDERGTDPGENLILLWPVGFTAFRRALFIAFIVPARLSRGGKGNAMKKGIRCNETRNDSREGRDRIRYEFLSDDGVTPSSCTVRLGDIDTVTGEAVTDVTIFREYYRLKDHQVRKNLKAERTEYTKEEAARRKEAREALSEEFRRRWGYSPSRDDLLYLMEERERWNLSVSVLVNEDGRDCTFQHRELSEPAAAEEEETVEMQALREVAASLAGRKAEVYQAMIQRAAGGQVRDRFSDIADRWDVSAATIHEEQEKIKEMVRRRAEELRKEDI